MATAFSNRGTQIVATKTLALQDIKQFTTSGSWRVSRGSFRVVNPHANFGWLQVGCRVECIVHGCCQSLLGCRSLHAVLAALHAAACCASESKTPNNSHSSRMDWQCTLVQLQWWWCV